MNCFQILVYITSVSNYTLTNPTLVENERNIHDQLIIFASAFGIKILLPTVGLPIKFCQGFENWDIREAIDTLKFVDFPKNQGSKDQSDCSLATFDFGLFFPDVDRIPSSISRTYGAL